MNFFTVADGIIKVVEFVLGPLESVAKDAIKSKVVSTAVKDVSSSGIMSIIESVVGSVADDKKALLLAQVKTLLGEDQLNVIDANSPRWWQWAARPTLLWGLTFALLFNLGLYCFANLMIMIGWDYTLPHILDPVSSSLLFGLLGVLHISSDINK